MLRRNIFRTTIYALGAGIVLGFGAGVAIRFTVPKAAEMAFLILEKLGFDIQDILLHLLDPEGSYEVRKPAKRKRTRASKKLVIVPV